MNKSEVIKFVESQKSLHLYKNIQDAFIDVLCRLSEDEFDLVKSRLIVMAFHNGVSGQVMHFPAKKNDFAVMQLYIPTYMPEGVLRHVIAHEIGHVMQKRNWTESDENKLEDDANEFAKKLGYPRSNEINDWLNNNR
jgi:hypothetical protein